MITTIQISNELKMLPAPTKHSEQEAHFYLLPGAGWSTPLNR